MEPSMSEKMQYNARIVVDHMREKKGVELELDRESVAWLSEYIDSVRGSLSEEGIDGLVNLFGSFLGEAIRSYFEGEWAQVKGQWAIAFDARNAVFPFNKTRKHFDEGAEESILSLFDAISQVFRRR